MLYSRKPTAPLRPFEGDRIIACCSQSCRLVNVPRKLALGDNRDDRRVVIINHSLLGLELLLVLLLLGVRLSTLSIWPSFIKKPRFFNPYSQPPPSLSNSLSSAPINHPTPFVNRELNPALNPPSLSCSELPRPARMGDAGDSGRALEEEGR